MTSSGFVADPLGRDVLPTNVKPTNYDLTLDLDAGSPGYSGKVEIDLELDADTPFITLNSVDLDIQNASVQISSHDVLDGLPVSYDKEKQTATIAITEPPTFPTKASLKLSFEGKFKSGMTGLFRAPWKTKDGSTKYQITSQFEPTDARTCFPCFDEPALKATFVVRIIADKNLTCLSNMPEAAVEDIGQNKKCTIYQRTPVMSTYLVAFAVGELNMIESNTFRVPVRLYTTPSNDIENGRWSLEVGAKTLAFFEEKLGIPFPLPKMDQVTVPDFMGAMENWGLVTYKEDALLCDPKTGTIAQKRESADFVLHELGHQWFGNAVTMDWWNGLWLNEGFATWISMYGRDVFFPEWNVRQHFLSTQFRGALDLDSLRNSHPIEAPVKNPDDIGQIFDEVSYSKGCCVIRMISAYLGEEKFLDGIKKYMVKHQFGNATTMDLWTALSEHTGIDVAEIMSKWTLHTGHPVVIVTENADSIHLKQTRFLLKGDATTEEDEVLYPIPLNVRNSAGEHTEMIFKTREIEIPMDKDFMKINSDHVGFYRTAYSSKRLERLGDQKSEFSVEDRVGILSDALALAPAGYQSTADVLSLITKYQDENNLYVWRQVIDAIELIRIVWMFEDESTQDGLRAFQRQLVTPKAHKLGWDLAKTDDEEEQQLQVLLFKAAATSGDETAKKAARDMFQRFKNGDRSAIHPDMKDAVFTVVLSDKNESLEAYETILNELQTVESLDERKTALNALGSATSLELTERTLGLLLTDEIRKQELWLPLETSKTHKNGLTASWIWMKQNSAAIQEKLDSGLAAIMGEVVSFCTSNFSSEEKANEVESYWKSKHSKAFDQSIAQCVERIQVKAKWLENSREEVRAWLKERNLQFTPDR